MFVEWLARQEARRDDVGVFARLVSKDQVFQKVLEDSNALHLALSRFEGMPSHRQMVKRVHREWRRWRKSEEGSAA